MTRIDKQPTALLLAGLSLFAVVGCSTKNYVKSQTTPLINKLRASGAQAVFPVSYLNDSLLIIRTMRQQKIDIPAIGGAAGYVIPDFEKGLGEFAQNVLSINTSNYDLAKARIATLQSSVIAARSKVEEASARANQSSDVERTGKQARAQADAAQAEVKVATALRDLAALNASYTKIIAPQDGVISKKSINVGQQLAAGQAIGQLVTDARWVTANFKETQVAEMHEGQPVHVKVDAFSSLELHGEIFPDTVLTQSLHLPARSLVVLRSKS